MYSFNDLKPGDIYEHSSGGLWFILYSYPTNKQFESFKINGINNEHQVHNVKDIVTIWLKCKHEKTNFHT